MSAFHKHREQRQFGRRTSRAHAWIIIDGRAPIACVVTNYSQDGARLTFDPAIRVPARFGLKTDAMRRAIMCEVRHGRDGFVGVHFVREPQTAGGAGAPALDELLGWLAR